MSAPRLTRLLKFILSPFPIREDSNTKNVVVGSFIVMNLPYQFHLIFSNWCIQVIPLYISFALSHNYSRSIWINHWQSNCYNFTFSATLWKETNSTLGINADYKDGINLCVWEEVSLKEENPLSPMNNERINCQWSDLFDNKKNFKRL